jgi:hypothetical protein
MSALGDLEALDNALALGFKALLQLVVENDDNHALRSEMLVQLLATAQQLGYEAGIRVDPDPPNWPIIQIELPTGSVSWHIKPHAVAWDGHSKEEKFRRIQEFLGG